MPPRYRPTCYPSAALLFLALTAAAAAQPAPYVFSERIGPEIDSAERSYFGLFPGVDGFTQARAFAEGDSVRVEIGTSAVDSVLVLPRLTAEALGRFVETFEQARAAFYNPNWQLVSKYVRADVPVPYAGTSRTATFFVEGGRYTGQVTYASDELLLLNRRGTRFDWQTFDGSGLTLRASEVDRVQLTPDWIGRPYVALAGVPLGIGVSEWLISLDAEGPENRLERHIFAAAFGAAAVKAFSIFSARTRPYEQALPNVKKAAWFTSEAHPLEMPPEAALDREADRPDPVPVWRGTFGWLGLGTGGVSLGENSQTYEFFSGFTPEADPTRAVQYEEAGALLEAAAAVRPIGWLDLGLGVYIASNPALEISSAVPVPFADIQEFAHSQPLFRVFADVDVVRLVRGESRLGLALGGGLLRAESTVALDVSNVEGRAGRIVTYIPGGYEITETGFNPFFQTTLSVGVERETSVYATLVAYSAPDVAVPLFEAGPDFLPTETVFRIEPHTVTFTYLGLSAGVRLAF